MMPFITSMFMPREFGDRPYVVPKNAVNFAFLGQFAETLDDPGRDTVFTIEYSGRTAMEAVYVLTGVEKDQFAVDDTVLPKHLLGIFMDKRHILGSAID